MRKGINGYAYTLLPYISRLTFQIGDKAPDFRQHITNSSKNNPMKQQK